MKHIKSYEAIDNKQPKIGNYIMMEYPYNVPSFYNNPERFEILQKFLENTIGKVIGVKNYDELDTITRDITVLYEYVPTEIRKLFLMVQGGWTINFNHTKIKGFSTSKNKLKLQLSANKYNL